MYSMEPGKTRNIYIFVFNFFYAFLVYREMGARQANQLSMYMHQTRFPFFLLLFSYSNQRVSALPSVSSVIYLVALETPRSNPSHPFTRIRHPRDFSDLSSSSSSFLRLSLLLLLMLLLSFLLRYSRSWSGTHGEPPFRSSRPVIWKQNWHKMWDLIQPFAAKTFFLKASCFGMLFLFLPIIDCEAFVNWVYRLFRAIQNFY